MGSETTEQIDCWAETARLSGPKPRDCRINQTILQASLNLWVLLQISFRREHVVQLLGGANHVLVVIVAEQRHSVIGVEVVGPAWSAQDAFGVVEIVPFKSMSK